MPSGDSSQLRVLGCDPLRRPDLTTIIADAKRRGFVHVAVETNGVRLGASGAAEALARAGLDEVILSAYSLDPLVHDVVTGRKGAHARMLQGLDQAARAGFELSLRVPLLSAKKQDLAALLRQTHARARKLHRVELLLPSGIPPAAEASEYLPEDLSRLRPRLAAAFEEAQRLSIQIQLLPNCGIPPCALPEAARSDRHVALPAASRDPARMGQQCTTCAEAPRCGGLPTWYLQRHGSSGLSPLSQPVAPSRRRANEPEALARFHKRKLTRRAGRFRLVLVNLSEATWGYGPGASEYLRAAVLSQPELADTVDVDILFLVGLSAEAAAASIAEAQPDLVGMSAYSWNLGQCGRVSRLLKSQGLEAPILWGGVSFAFLHRDASWFSWWDAVDAIARGSGEHTLIDLTQALIGQKGRRSIPKGMPGLVRVIDGTPEFGPEARVPELDDFPSPYLMGTLYRVARPTIEMARGCTFSCTFCSDAKQSREGRMQMRSQERLAAEVAAVVAWPESEWLDAGASTANVTDQAFARVCEAIRNGDPKGKLRYGFQLYPSLARPAQREALSGVPVGALHFGVQSLTPETFAPIKRGTRMAHLARAVEVFEGVGPLELSLILGLPGETLQSFKQTFDRTLELGSARVVVNRLLVLPGTELHLRRRLHRLGVDDERYYRVTQTPTMSTEDLRRAQDYVIERALALPDPVQDGDARVRWVGFDVQQSFSAPPEYAGRVA